MSAGSISLNASSISIVGSNAVSLNHYPDPKLKNTGIPKGITIDSTDVSFKVEDGYFEGKEKKSFPIEAEPEPPFSSPPKQIEQKKVAAKSGNSKKNEARVESGEKTLLKGLGLAALAVGMAALTIATGGAALAVAGVLMEGGIVSTAVGVGVAAAAVAGTTMGVAGATMEGDIAEATVEEGCNEISNGEEGKDEQGYNRIRDGEFGGDEDAYQKYQDQAMGLWETGVMINMTAASAGSELVLVAGSADMYLSSKLPNLSNMFAPKEEELICSSNPLLEVEESWKTIYPPRTQEAISESKNVVDIMDNKMGMGGGKFKAVSVFTHEDGTVSVGLSCKGSEKDQDFASQLESKLNIGKNNKINGQNKYTVSCTSIPTDNIETIEGGNPSGLCAEPKVANAAYDNQSQIIGMDTRWRGKGENKYPYTGENANGHPVDPNQMDPCPTCAYPNNAKEYMKYANANTK